MEGGVQMHISLVWAGGTDLILPATDGHPQDSVREETLSETRPQLLSVDGEVNQVWCESGLV